MAIGVSKNEFYHSTLVGLRDYDKAYEIRRKLEDQRDYICCIYHYEAIATALSNAFRPKGAKAAELRKQPILAKIGEKQLTQEEIAQREADKTFHRLEIMSFNHRLEEQRRQRLEV